MTAAVEVPSRRGRPRDPGVDAAILDAALHVLAEDGFGRLTVERVAEMAGVGKAAIYRRFAAKDELIACALSTLNDDLPPAPAAGSVRDRLIVMLERIRERTAETLNGRIMLRVAAEGQTSPHYASMFHDRVIEPRRRRLRALLQEACAAGELRADLDDAVLIPLLVGPMLYLAAWRCAEGENQPATPALVDALLAGVAG